MQIKNITYQRVLNLGNYESKRLELLAEVFEGEDPEEAISRLMETVERKVREQTSEKIEGEIKQLQQELRQLKKEYESVQSSLSTLTTPEEPDPDSIPFDSGDTSLNADSVPDGF